MMDERHFISQHAKATKNLFDFSSMMHVFDHSFAIGTSQFSRQTYSIFSWDRTPLDDAITFGRIECMKILRDVSMMNVGDTDLTEDGACGRAQSMGIWPKQFYKRSFSDDEDEEEEEAAVMVTEKKDDSNERIQSNNDSSAEDDDDGRMASAGEAMNRSDSGVEESVIDDYSRESTTTIQ